MLIDGRPARPKHIERPEEIDALPLLLPHAYTLLKLLFLPNKLSWPVGAEGVSVTPEPEILGRLHASDIDGACEIAVRRLRASGFLPMPGPTSGGAWRRVKFGSSPDATRLAATLLFPVGNPTELAKRALRPPADERTESAM